MTARLTKADIQGLVERLTEAADRQDNAFPSLKHDNECREAAAALRELEGRCEGLEQEFPPQYERFQAAFERHPWYRKRIDGTPLSNDLAVIADRVMRQILHPEKKYQEPNYE
jgi:hypothetical protein